MRVSDAMTTDVISVEPETPLKEAARVLAEKDISGVPVLEASGAVIGVLSESDIVARQTGRPTRRRRLLSSGDPEFAPATVVGQAMSAPPITVPPSAPLAGAAWIMTKHDVNRLPVVTGDVLVGVISRGDIVRAFARSDEDIQRELENDLLPAFDAAVTVAVNGGSVTLAGEVERNDDAVHIVRAVERLTGVVAVKSELRPRRPAPVEWTR
jgi:CBS domain-containing protein